jgi:hypothetical protein
MAVLWLVCEGEPGSVDVALLQRVFADVLAAEIVVEPACGGSPSPVARFLENRLGGGKAAFVHDRDYRPRSEAEAAFADGKPGFFWRRHSIENYLLPPPIILQAFQNLRERFERQRRGGIPPWFAALPGDPEGVAEALRECARQRVAEEACRLATYRLWDALPPSVGQVQKRNPPRPTGVDPNDWQEALCQEAERACLAAAQTAECAAFRREAVILLFETAYAEVTTTSYVGGMEFLIDFHGRDLLKAFHQWLGSRKIPMSYKRLCDELIPAAVQQYRDNRTIYGNDDFRDLANGARSLAGLAPLA